MRGILGAVALLIAAAAPVMAAPAIGRISSAGPLTDIIVSTELNCQVAHIQDSAFEFYGPEIGACGTFVAVDGTLFGPSEIPSGTGFGNLVGWTPVSQSPVSGVGTEPDPLRLVTVVEAAGVGLRLEQLDSYIVGQESYRTDIRLIDTSGVERRLIVYRAGDCFLQDSDVGFGRLDGAAPACITEQSAGSRVDQWLPITGGSRAIEGPYDEVWAAVGSQQPFPDTCTCAESVDNGAGLSWDVVVPASGEAIVSHRTFFSPEGNVPDEVGGEPFARSFPTPAEIVLDPIVVVQSAAIAAAVVLLIPFPATLFNATLEEHYDEVMAGFGRFRAWLRRRLGLPPAAPPGPDDAPRDPWRRPLRIVGFVLLSAALYLLLDPTLGLGATSLATFAGLAIGIGVTLVVFTVPMWLAAQRAGIGFQIRALPATLAIAAACVLISRVADFQPGYLYGLIIGYMFARELSVAEEGRPFAHGTAALLVTALIAWIAMLFVRQSSTDLVDIAAGSAAATIVVAGLEGAVFGMLPLRFLPGERVRAWDRRWWMALMGIGTFALCHILLNPTNGYLADQTRSSFVTIVVLLVGFTIASVAFWAWFRFRRRGPIPHV